MWRLTRSLTVATSCGCAAPSIGAAIMAREARVSVAGAEDPWAPTALTMVRSRLVGPLLCTIVGWRRVIGDRRGAAGHQAELNAGGGDAFLLAG